MGLASCVVHIILFRPHKEELGRSVSDYAAADRVPGNFSLCQLANEKEDQPGDALL